MEKEKIASKNWKNILKYILKNNYFKYLILHSHLRHRRYEFLGEKIFDSRKKKENNLKCWPKKYVEYYFLISTFSLPPPPRILRIIVTNSFKGKNEWKKKKLPNKLSYNLKKKKILIKQILWKLF